MRKNIVLIDFENVQPESLAGLAPEHFQVKIFLGANQASIPTTLARSTQPRGDGVEYVQISGTGPNALDFHIAFYIGQFAEKDPTACFHIVSKDKGFNPLIEHLKSRHITVVRSDSIDDIPAIKHAAATSPKKRANAFIAQLQKPGFTKPNTRETLSNAINCFFQNRLSAAETDAVIAVLQAKRHITVEDEKIVYTR